MAQSSIIIVDAFADIVSAMAPALTKQGLSVNYTYGRQPQILTHLQKLNNSITQKNNKYPLLALFLPFKEQFGGDYYATVTFPKIVIATLSNNTDTPEKRYQEAFKKILYPVFEEFKKQIARHPNIIMQNEDYLQFKKQDNPGSPPPQADKSGGIQFADYVDAIEIYDLQLTFQAKTNC
jgi:hypothetical protein